MQGEFPYEQVTPWLEEPTDLCPSLHSELRADVAVIGGGYTGLSAALHLRRQGVDVVLLEQGFAGSGASGRNAGHLTPTIGKDLPTLVRVFGAEYAGRLVRFADEAVEYTEDLIEIEAIDCDYRPSGNVVAAVHPTHEKRLRLGAEVARKLGSDVEFLDTWAMRDRQLPAAFHCGVLEERGGVLDPGKYVLALRRAALDAGVRLYERTRVQELSDGKPLRLRCPSGRVTTDMAIIATNAYPPPAGELRRLVAPLRVSLLETQPLRSEQLRALGWPGREGIYTSHEVLESYRLTERQTLVGGSKVVRYAWGGRLAKGYDRQAFRSIESAYRDRFRELGDHPVARFWGGWVGFAPDLLPLVGATGQNRNIHFGIGFAGHGVAQATLMGAMLAERMFGQAHEWEVALHRRHLRWPPEPLRWLAYKAITGALAVVDSRTDRRARSNPLPGSEPQGRRSDRREVVA